METKEKLRDVNHKVRQATAIAALIPAKRRAQDIMQDDDVRAAAREVLGWLMELRRDLGGSDGKLGRLARDPHVQDEIAALVRSAAKAVDAGSKVGKRRVRRRTARLVVAAAAITGLLVWAQRMTGAPDAEAVQ